MRRITAVVFLAFALLVSSFTLTSANASGDDSFRLTTKSYQLEEIDLGAKGESLGDQVVFSDDVFKKHHPYGSLDGFCTTTRIDSKGFNQQCVVTLTLPKGQLTSQGVIRFDKHFDDKFTLAITGGTGRYSGAGGEAHVKFVSETKTLIKVELEN